jgi:hypothetical protein
MTAIAKVTKIRPNQEVPFKDPTQPLNCPTWPGFIEIANIIFSEDSLTKIMDYRFENRSNYENPTLTAEQIAVKTQGENWCTNNNIIVTIDVIDE